MERHNPVSWELSTSTHILAVHPMNLSNRTSMNGSSFATKSPEVSRTATCFPCSWRSSPENTKSNWKKTRLCERSRMPWRRLRLNAVGSIKHVLPGLHRAGVRLLSEGRERHNRLCMLLPLLKNLSNTTPSMMSRTS